MKRIRFAPGVPRAIRVIDRRDALTILQAVHRYVEGGHGDVKSLSGEFEGLFRLRVGRYRVLFDESETEIQVHSVSYRKNAYR